LQNVIGFGRPNEGLGVAVVQVDVLLDGFAQFDNLVPVGILGCLDVVSYRTSYSRSSPDGVSSLIGASRDSRLYCVMAFTPQLEGFRLYHKLAAQNQPLIRQDRLFRKPVNSRYP